MKKNSTFCGNVIKTCLIFYSFLFLYIWNFLHLKLVLFFYVSSIMAGGKNDVFFFCSFSQLIGFFIWTKLQRRKKRRKEGNKEKRKGKKENAFAFLGCVWKSLFSFFSSIVRSCFKRLLHIIGIKKYRKTRHHEWTSTG